MFNESKLNINNREPLTEQVIQKRQIDEYNYLKRKAVTETMQNPAKLKYA